MALGAFLLRHLRRLLVTAVVVAALLWLAICQWIAPLVADAKREKVEKVRSSAVYRTAFAAKDLLAKGSPNRDAARDVVREFDAMDRGPWLERPWHLLQLTLAYGRLQGE